MSGLVLPDGSKTSAGVILPGNRTVVNVCRFCGNMLAGESAAKAIVEHELGCKPKIRMRFIEASLSVTVADVLLGKLCSEEPISYVSEVF